jgi:ABC-2 type transport system permease protein
MAGLAFAAFGIIPRFAFAISWTIFAAMLLLELGWEMRQVSQSVFAISPFAHVHWATAEIAAAPIVWLFSIAAFLAAAGFAGLRYRDIR